WWTLRDSEHATTPAARQLRQAYRLSTLQAMFQAGHLTRAVSVLRDAGVEPLLAKGWAVARLYPEPGLRPAGDIDLCVRPEQYSAAQRAVRCPGGPGGLADLHAGLNRKRDGQAFALLDDRRLDDLYQRSQRVRI